MTLFYVLLSVSLISFSAHSAPISSPCAHQFEAISRGGFLPINEAAPLTAENVLAAARVGVYAYLNHRDPDGSLAQEGRYQNREWQAEDHRGILSWEKFVAKLTDPSREL